MKGEYWYSKIPPQILVEERLHGVSFDIPRDYKFYVFHGHVEYVHVDIDRYGEHKRNFYDRDWDMKTFELEYPLGPMISQPRTLDHMINVAETLGAKFDFIRIDLYDIRNRGVVFGEMTIAPGSGCERFKPESYDHLFGSYW